MDKILAIIITHDRLGELKQCLRAVRGQTHAHPDILVVDNASSDGTREFLDSEPGLAVIHQANLGGAGGFHAGERYALEHGYDWVWMMDDDGEPAPDQLECLCDYAGRHPGAVVLNALVVDRDNHLRLAFPVEGWDYDRARATESADFVHPYNGTFLHRSVLERAGLAKKEMFIWGDEIEYMLRVARLGYKPTTVTRALHYHPAERGSFDVLLPGVNRRRMIKPKHFSHHFYRNLGYIHQTYYRPRWYKGLKPMFWYAVYFARKGDFPEARKAVKYYLRGLHNDFSD